MTDQYIKRKIDVTLMLGKGDFGQSGVNTITASGLRCSANIIKTGGPGYAMAELRVWGLTESVMNAASNLGRAPDYERVNYVTIMAGDDTSGMSREFYGLIQTAYQDFSDSGAASLNISAITSVLDQVKPAPPTSFNGAADVATIVNGLATYMGLNFVNYGVQITLSHPYFWGTAKAQLDDVCHAANILYVIDDQTVCIWPKDGVRGGQIPNISPTSGLVGYPKYTSQGVTLRTLYRPGLIMGGFLNLDTSITRAKGLWRVRTLVHNLESEMPGGAWFSDMDCYRTVADTGAVSG